MKRHFFFLLVFLLTSVAFHAQDSQNSTQVAPPQGEPNAVVVPSLPPQPPQAPARFRGNPRGGAIQAFFQQLKKTNPEEYQRLLKLRMENHEEFLREMERLMPRQAREFGQKQSERDRECWKLARKIRECQDETEKAALTAELEKKLSDMTDEMIQDMQKRVKEMETRLTFLQENREDVLKKRLHFFLNAPLPPAPPKKE